MHSNAAHEDPEELGLSNQSPNQTLWDGKLEGKMRKIVDIELAAHGLAVIEPTFRTSLS